MKMLNVCAFLFMVSTTISGVSSNNSSRSCTLPMYPTYGTYTVTSDPSAKPGQTMDSFIMMVSCRRGYGIQESGNHSQEVFCIGGVWTQEMPKCVRFCRLNAHHSMRYECRLPGQGQSICEGFVPPRTTVIGTCKPQFFSANEVEYMSCMEYGIWDRIVNCQAECGLVTPQAKLQIVGGKFANFGEFPWHVGIYDKTKQPYGQICSGSIITNNVVISAAHCFWDDFIKLLPETQFIVATAKLYRKWNDEKDILAQKSEIKKIKIPSLFIGSAASFQQDIASLILKSPFTYLPYLRPVCYDFNNFFEQGQLQHGNLGKVSGWGLTAANGGPSPALKIADMPYVSEDVCVKGVPKSFRVYITGDKFCAGYTDGSSAVCEGDSGGGLVFPALERNKERFYLRGIVSASPQNSEKLCNDYTYTAFTKISEHKKFILESIAEGSPMECQSYLFQCNDGSCVYPEAECNGIADCKDGSDESYENCTPGATTTTTTEAPEVCILPPYPEHGRYEVNNEPNARPGFQADSFVVTVTCDDGYGLEADGIVNDTTSAEVYCFDGQWIPELPRCVRFCKLNPDPSVRYTCQVPGTNAFNDCENYVPPDTVVQPVCNSNYYYNGVLKRMRCLAGVGSFDSEAQCKPDCGRVNPEGSSLIIGGKAPKGEELPWHVIIYSKDTTPYIQIAGGSLVSNTVVISAAHCFWDVSTSKAHPAANYAAAIGKLYRPWNDLRDEDAQKSDVAEIRIPRLFLGHSNNYQEDISILVLTTAFVYKTNVRPVCLNFDPIFERQQLQSNHLGKVPGWGITSVNGVTPQVLKVVELPYIDDNTCIDTMPEYVRRYLTRGKFCAGYTNKSSLCRGDSGGGLAFLDNSQGAQRYYLRGIVSLGLSQKAELCNVNSFISFTKISQYEQLITDSLQKNR